MSEASGRDLSTWSKEWLETAGVNTLRPQFDCRDDGAFTSFAVLQEAPEDHPTLRSHRLRVGLYDRTGDGSWCAASRSSSTSSAPAPRCPSWSASAQPDLVLVNDDDLTYAKIRLDERSLRTLRRPHRRARATRCPGRCAGTPPGT